MIISALKSNNPKDNRSPIHKETISTLINLGIEIWFENNIGEGVNTSNEIFQQLGLKKH